MVTEEQRKDRDGGAKQLSIICQGGEGGQRERGRLLSLLQVKIYSIFSECESRWRHWQKNALNSGGEFIIE